MTTPMTPPSTPQQSGAPAPLQVQDARGVRTITLDRPKAFNSFNLELKGALLAALADAAAEDSVRAVVVTGAGAAFCAGQDLKEHLALVAAADPRVGTTVAEFYNPLVRAVTGMAKPVIAAVNGAAAGAGAGLAFACDLRVAAESASFSMAFAGVALSADTGASFVLPRLIGAGRASRMMLLGERVDAQEALRIGMVDVVTSDDELEPTVRALAERLAAGSDDRLRVDQGIAAPRRPVGPGVDVGFRGPGATRVFRLPRSPRGHHRLRREAGSPVRRPVGLSSERLVG